MPSLKGSNPMTLTVDLSSDAVARLKAEAERRAVPIENVINAMILATLPEPDAKPNPKAMEIASRIIKEHSKTWNELAKY